ncbi:MAG: hypothetical protein KF861_19710, partial [Planctomycetaceae bacterium]|nr:hypothetical protein [Planctomycetaceae bacterium]
MRIGCVRWIVLVAACLLFLVQAPLAAAQETIFKEDFSNGKQIKGEVFPSLTYLLMALLKPSQAQELTWSLSGKLGPGKKARLPKKVDPPIFTGNENEYWAGRLLTTIGWLTVGDDIDVSQHSDLKLKLRWAAAEEGQGLSQQNHFKADDYVIIVAYYKVKGRWDVKVVDQFEGDKKSSALTSKLTQKTSRPVFTDEEWDLEKRLGIKAGAVERLNFLIIASTDTEFIGFDTLEVTGTTVGAQDRCPDDPNKTEPGLCGCGVPDTDSDGDGTPNCNDQCPRDPHKNAPGACGCGTPDTDSDGDGTPNCHDQCPRDPHKNAPGVCGCGIPDTDSDGDGTPDCQDRCPRDPHKIEPGECGCGRTEAECADGCPDDPHKTEPGICGCGVPDTDSDGDGTLDCNDECPSDPAKITPGACGCGVADTDEDG